MNQQDAQIAEEQTRQTDNNLEIQDIKIFANKKRAHRSGFFNL